VEVAARGFATVLWARIRHLNRATRAAPTRKTIFVGCVNQAAPVVIVQVVPGSGDETSLRQGGPKLFA
jgi:hypothetical protein